MCTFHSATCALEGSNDSELVSFVVSHSKIVRTKRSVELEEISRVDLTRVHACRICRQISAEVIACKNITIKRLSKTTLPLPALFNFQ